MLPLFGLIPPLHQSNDCDALGLKCPAAPTGATLANFIRDLIANLLLPLSVVGTVLVAVIIYASVRYITAHGSTEEVQRAKMILVYAVIGLVFLAVTFWLWEKITPYSLWKELIDEHNTALAIVVASLVIGISIIISTAIR